MPARLEASEEIVVTEAIEKCYAFFTDLSNIGSCIPGCESVTGIDATSALFKVKLKVGYISKTFEVKAKLKEMIQNTRLSFDGVGPDAEIMGKVELGRDDEGTGTSIKYTIEISPVSVTGKTAVSMMGKSLVKSQASEFAACVKRRLEASK